MVKQTKPQLSLKLFSNVVPAKWMDERFIPPVYGGNMPPRSQANRISGNISAVCDSVTHTFSLTQTQAHACTHLPQYTHTHTHTHNSYRTSCNNTVFQYVTAKS